MFVIYKCVNLCVSLYIYFAWSLLSLRAECMFIRTLLFINKCYIDLHEFRRHICILKAYLSPASDWTGLWQRLFGRAINVIWQSNGFHIVGKIDLWSQLKRKSKTVKNKKLKWVCWHVLCLILFDFSILYQK